MIVLIVIGIVLSLAGLGGLIWLMRHALWLKSADLDEATAKRETAKLVTGHMASIGTAFLGMGLLLAGLLLG